MKPFSGKIATLLLKGAQHKVFSLNPEENIITVLKNSILAYLEVEKKITLIDSKEYISLAANLNGNSSQKHKQQLSI